MIPVTRVVRAVPGSIMSSRFLQFPFPPSSRSESWSCPCSQMATLAPLKQNRWGGRGQGDHSSPESRALGGLHGLDAWGLATTEVGVWHGLQGAGPRRAAWGALVMGLSGEQGPLCAAGFFLLGPLLPILSRPRQLGPGWRMSELGLGLGLGLGLPLEMLLQVMGSKRGSGLGPHHLEGPRGPRWLVAWAGPLTQACSQEDGASGRG